ncbi:MAG: hypothetical protein ACK5NQ_08740 [Pseudomonas sp.]
MTNRTAFRLFLLFGLATVVQIWLMPHVSYETAHALFNGVIGCTIAGGLLIWRYAPPLENRS